jgi:hypothetical protein
MNKKYVEYYLVEINNRPSYRKLESDLPFSKAEGKKELKIKYPTAKITCIAKSKAEGFLALNKI